MNAASLRWFRLLPVVLVWNISCKSTESGQKQSIPFVHGMAAAPFRAVIFGAGPDTHVRPRTVEILNKSFRRAYPKNSQFYTIEKFSLDKLPKLNLPPGSKVHLILNAHGMTNQGDHWISTEDGLLKTVEVGKALGRLYGEDGTVDIETSLITCFAGATDCNPFPGGVFGAASDQSVAYAYSFAHFIQGLDDNLYRFPMSANEMYQEYYLAARAAKTPIPHSKPLSAWRKNCKGIVGLKTEIKPSAGEGMSLIQEEPKVIGVCYSVDQTVEIF